MDSSDKEIVWFVFQYLLKVYGLSSSVWNVDTDTVAAMYEYVLQHIEYWKWQFEIINSENLFLLELGSWNWWTCTKNEEYNFSILSQNEGLLSPKNIVFVVYEWVVLWHVKLKWEKTFIAYKNIRNEQSFW